MGRVWLRTSGELSSIRKQDNLGPGQEVGFRNGPRLTKVVVRVLDGAELSLGISVTYSDGATHPA